MQLWHTYMWAYVGLHYTHAYIVHTIQYIHMWRMCISGDIQITAQDLYFETILYDLTVIDFFALMYMPFSSTFGVLQGYIIIIIIIVIILLLLLYKYKQSIHTQIYVYTQTYIHKCIQCHTYLCMHKYIHNIVTLVK